MAIKLQMIEEVATQHILTAEEEAKVQKLLEKYPDYTVRNAVSNLYFNGEIKIDRNKGSREILWSKITKRLNKLDFDVDPDYHDFYENYTYPVEEYDEEFDEMLNRQYEEAYNREHKNK